MSPDVLGAPALNRALLARQLLLRRADLSPTQALEHLVGVQAQIPNSPYIGLWTRLAGFRHDDLSVLVRKRRAVRGTLMRGTLHLVTARDYRALRPLMQPVLGGILKSGFARALSGTRPSSIASAGRALVESRPRRGAEIGSLLSRRWPGVEPRALSYAVQFLTPLVQIPPRGVWGESAPPTWASAESWLGRPLDERPSSDRLIRRYLAAFGPATLADIRAWSRLAGVGRVVERLRPRLRMFRDERGRELYDLPEAPRPDPATPAPPRFLPFYDNAALGHADRARIVDPAIGARIRHNEGLLVGTVLIDGFVRGLWRIDAGAGRATLRIQPLARVGRPDRTALAEEGRRLLAFAASEAESHEVRIARG